MIRFRQHGKLRLFREASTPLDAQSVPICFGVFRLDLGTGELHKNGQKIKIEPQPLQILALLLDRPGELVTQAQITSKLWPNGTVVEFEHSIKTALGKLRQALADDANTPRYIETLPRRGYRFIGQVERVLPTPQSQPLINSVTTPGTLLLPTAEDREPSRGLGHWAGVLGGAVLIAIAGLVFQLSRPLPPPKVTDYVQLTHDGRQKTTSPRSPHPGHSFPLTTDGSRIYFWENLSQQLTGQVAQISIAGGEPVPLPIALPDPFVCGISPNGAELLLLNAKSLPWTFWTLALPGGSPRRLGGAAGWDAAWSPDGQRIVYTTGSDVYVVRSDGSEPRKIVTVPGEAWRPRISPDGSRIRLTVYTLTNASGSLWEVSMNGSQLHPLLPGWSNPPEECCGDWTPDGKYFVFQSNRDFKKDIWALREGRRLFGNPDRTPVRLTSGPMNYWAPLPSKDGKRLFVIGEQPRGELVRYDAKLHVALPYLNGISGEQLTFSRDGRWFAYVDYLEGTLWRSKIDGSQRLQLSSPPLRTAFPRWSPDGREIAFTAMPPGQPWRLYLVSADGGPPEELMPHEPDQEAADWSPDGKSLIFCQYHVVDAEKMIYHLRVLDLKTRRVTALPGGEGLSGPRVSPDALHVVSMSADHRRLVLVDLKSHKTAELAGPFRPFGASPLEWSRDSKYVYFAAFGDNIPPRVSRVQISEHKSESIANLTQIQLARGIWGFYVGLAADYSPIMLREAATEEIYALDWEAP